MWKREKALGYRRCKCRSSRRYEVSDRVVDRVIEVRGVMWADDEVTYADNQQSNMGEAGESCCCEIGFGRRARGHGEGHRDSGNNPRLDYIRPPPRRSPPGFVVVIIIPCSMTPYHTRPETTNPPCEQGRGRHMMLLDPSVTGSQLDRSLFPARARRLGLSHPTPHSPLPLPPPRISPLLPPKTWLGISRERAWAGGRRRNLFPSLGIPCSRLSADHLPLGNIQSSSLDSSIHFARQRRAAGETQIHKSIAITPATAIPITGSCLACLAHISHLLSLVAICGRF